MCPERYCVVLNVIDSLTRSMHPLEALVALNLIELSQIKWYNHHIILIVYADHGIYIDDNCSRCGSPLSSNRVRWIVFIQLKADGAKCFHMFVP